MEPAGGRPELASPYRFAPVPVLDPLARPVRRFLHRAVRLDPFPDPELVRTRWPVVLVHGLGALGTVFQMGLLSRHAAHLRQHGTLAFAPNVTPYDTTAVRGRQWEDHLRRILEETGAERLNLIGYSAGGLDARYVVSSLGWSERVASVITVATPNHGSALAEWTLACPSALRTLLVGVMDRWGRLSYKDAEPQVAAGLEELTPSFVEEQFNPANPNVDGVFYGSWAGYAGKGTDVRITPALVAQNRILYTLAGVNDGMVPLESAKWGDVIRVVGNDHLRMAGVTPGSAGRAKRLFLDIVRDLVARGY
jgi:triacylglycerol lipase